MNRLASLIVLAVAGVPTLVVGANRDPTATAAHGRAFAERTGGRQMEVPGAAHGMMIHCAERIHALLCEHLTGAGSTSV